MSARLRDLDLSTLTKCIDGVGGRVEEVGDLGREGGGQRGSVAGEDNFEGEAFSCLNQIIFSLS